MNFSLNLDDIKYVKIIYKDKDNSAHCVKAAIRTINERQIYVCAKQENPISIGISQEITLSFICENGLYRTKTDSFQQHNVSSDSSLLLHRHSDRQHIPLPAKATLQPEHNRTAKSFSVVFCSIYPRYLLLFLLLSMLKISFSDNVPAPR